MVALAIGEEYEDRKEYGKAEKWFGTAEDKFPKQEWKNKAKKSLERIKNKKQTGREEKSVEGSKKSENEISLKEINLEELEPEHVLFVVSCTKSKIWDSDSETSYYVPAKDAYKGKTVTEFKKWRDLNNFEERGFKWLILSGKYGFIEPTQPISHYDVTFSNPQSGPISVESLIRQVKGQKRWEEQIRLDSFGKIYCLANEVYLNRVRCAFESNDVIRVVF